MANFTNVSAIVSNEPTIIGNIGIAIGIFLIGLVVGRILGKLTKSILESVAVDKLLINKNHKTFSAHIIIGELVSIATYIVFTIVALNYIGITNQILTIIGGIILLVLLVSTYLALRDSLPNMMAYSKLVKNNTLGPGDTITMDNTKGKVLSVNLYEVQVETREGDIIYIPNRLFLKEKLKVHKAAKVRKAKQVKK